MTKSKKYFCQSRISQSCDHVKLTILAMATFCIFSEKMTKSKKYFCQSRISQSCDHVKLTILAMATFCILKKWQRQKIFLSKSHQPILRSRKVNHSGNGDFLHFPKKWQRKNDKVQKIFLSKSHQPILRSRKVNHSGNGDFLHFQKKWQSPKNIFVKVASANLAIT